MGAHRSVMVAGVVADRGLELLGGEVEYSYVTPLYETFSPPPWGGVPIQTLLCPPVRGRTRPREGA